MIFSENRYPLFGIMLVAVAATALSALLLPVDRAGAEITYPWCAQYNLQGGARNCGFNTEEQCRATVSGVGGYCERNPLYQPAAGPRRRYR
jgi:Protein of unknown function (DUF3551)